MNAGSTLNKLKFILAVPHYLYEQSNNRDKFPISIVQALSYCYALQFELSETISFPSRWESSKCVVYSDRSEMIKSSV